MNDGLPLKALEWMQPLLLLDDLPTLFDGWQWIVGVLAFLLLVGGHGYRLYEVRNDSRAIMHEWYVTVLALVFAVVSPVIVDYTLGLGENQLPGPMANDVSRKMVLLAFTFPDVESLMAREGNQDPSAEEALREEGIWGYGNAFWEDLESDILLEDSDGRTVEITASATEQAMSLKAWSVLGTYVITTTSLVVSAVLAWFMDFVREVLAMGLSFILPALIACFRVRSLKAVGHRGVMLFVGVALWPLVWALAHKVTAKLFDGYVSVYQGGGPTDGLSWDGIDASGASREWAGLVDQLGMAVPYSWLLLVNLASIGLMVWSCACVVGIPWLVQRGLRWAPSSFATPAARRNQIATAGASSIQ